MFFIDTKLNELYRISDTTDVTLDVTLNSLEMMVGLKTIMKKSIWHLSILLLLLLCSCEQFSQKDYEIGQGYRLSLKNGQVVADVPWVVSIEKEPGSDFVILNFTDIQLGNDDYFLRSDEVFSIMDKSVEQIKPDLITFTGDIAYGCESSFYGICSHLDSYNIPWAPVFGNHEFENCGISTETQYRVIGNFKNCLFKDGPSKLLGSKGNYVVNIVEYDDSDFRVVKSLIMFNSGKNGIQDIQTEWYSDCVNSISPSKSAVFMHIPCDVFFEAGSAAYKHPRTTSLEESYTNSSAVWNAGYEDSFGVWQEGYSTRVGDSLKNKIFDSDSTDLAVAGHDHINNYCIRYNGVQFVFALKTGFGCYYDPKLCGATVITVNDSGESSVRHLYDSELN